MVNVIVFIIIAAMVLVTGVMVFNGEWALSWKTVSVIFVGLIFIGAVAIGAGNVPGNADELRFAIEGDTYKMYYDQNEEQYFTVNVSSLWNPIKWLDKEYIDPDKAKEFFEIYEKYQENSNDLQDVNPFNAMNRSL